MSRAVSHKVSFDCYGNPDYTERSGEIETFSGFLLPCVEYQIAPRDKKWSQLLSSDQRNSDVDLAKWNMQ